MRTISFKILNVISFQKNVKLKMKIIINFNFITEANCVYGGDDDRRKSYLIMMSR